ncbi:MAG: hypothetical protein WD470_01825 [Rhodospirillaceae bacterium]
MKKLTDRRRNLGQNSRCFSAMQVWSIVDRSVFVVVLLIFAGLFLRILF